jgi:hypothetical protein
VTENCGNAYFFTYTCERTEIISKYEITKAFFDVNFQNSFQTEEELPLFSTHGFERQVSIAGLTAVFFFGYYYSTSQKSQKGELYKELRKNVCFEEKRAAGVRVFGLVPCEGYELCCCIVL